MPERLADHDADVHQSVGVLTSEERCEERAAPWWPAMVVAGVVLAVFGVVVTFDLVVWDDPAYIVFNPLVADWWAHSVGTRLLTPGLGYPVPIPVAIYAAASSLGPAVAPALIHLVAVVAHVGNALLAWMLMRRYIPPSAAVLAPVAVLAWALHPTTVEAVAWASNLKEPLATFGMLLALVGFERLLEAESRRATLAVVGGVLIGLGSKPIAGMIGFVFIARLLASQTPRRPWRLAIATAVGGSAWIVAAMAAHETLAAGQEGAFATRSWLTTCFAAFGNLWRSYILPLDLQPYYPLEVREWTALASFGVVALIVGAAAFALAVRRDRIAAFGLVAAAICYAPYSNVVPLPRITADTYAYLPSFFLLVALGRFAAATRRPRAVAAGGTIVVLLLTALTLQQIPRWSSTQKLFGPMLGDPEWFSLPYALVAYDLHLRGKEREALRTLDEAWEPLMRSGAVPAFATEAYAGAGRGARASDALVRSAVHRGDSAVRDAVARMARERLPAPETEGGRAIVRRSLRQYPAQENEQQWLRQIGFEGTVDE